MISKKQLIFFIVAVAALTGFIVIGFNTSTPKTDTAEEQAVWPSREVEKVTINDATAGYSVITAAYPKTASDSITMYFKSFVDEQIKQFKDDTSWVADQPDSAQAQSLSLDISYTSVQATNVQTYVFLVNTYTGGAHGMQVRKTFSFNKEGQLLTISNVFTNGVDGLSTFAKVVQKNLLSREGIEASWVTDGAAVKEENYSAFIVNDSSITILFDPYQVAPYSFGPVDVVVPLKSFAKIANPALFVAPPTQ